MLNITKIVNTNKTTKIKKVTQDFNKLLIAIKLSFNLTKVTIIIIKQN